MKKMKENIIVLFKGFVMGVAEIIPGVSGATLALVMGIYSRFIGFLYQISNLIKETVLFFLFKSNLKNIIQRFKEIDFTFGLILYLGRFLALVFLANGMNFLLTEKREYILAFFFGLILASIAIPWGEIKQKGLKEIVLILFSTLAFFFLFSLRPHEFVGLPHPLYFFAGGAIAICAMVLPGISGSLVFLMLGLYEFIVAHLSNLTRFSIERIEIINLFFLSLGVVFGFSIFVRILRHGLKNYSSVIFAILTGIMIASLRILWPYYEGIDLMGIAFLLFLSSCGFAVVFFLRKLG